MWVFLLKMVGLDPANLTKYLLILGGIVAAGVILFGAYKFWEHEVAQEALNGFNAKQIEQVAKDVKAFQDTMDKVEKNQEALIKSQQDFSDNLDKKTAPVEVYLKSDDAKKADRPSSDVLKNTIRLLQSAQGVK